MDSASQAELDSLLDELDATLHRVGRLVASRQAEFVRDAGLSASQYMVLKALDSEGPMRVSDVASMLGVKNPAASGLIQSLEEDGLLQRGGDASDNRVVLVDMAPAGRAALARSEAYRRRIISGFTAALSLEDLRTLVRIHGILADSLARGGFDYVSGHPGQGFASPEEGK